MIRVHCIARYLHSFLCSVLRSIEWLKVTLQYLNIQQRNQTFLMGLVFLYLSILNIDLFDFFYTFNATARPSHPSRPNIRNQNMKKSLFPCPRCDLSKHTLSSSVHIVSGFIPLHQCLSSVEVCYATL